MSNPEVEEHFIEKAELAKKIWRVDLSSPIISSEKTPSFMLHCINISKKGGSNSAIVLIFRLLLEAASAFIPKLANLRSKISSGTRWLYSQMKITPAGRIIVIYNFLVHCVSR